MATTNPKPDSPKDDRELMDAHVQAVINCYIEAGFKPDPPTRIRKTVEVYLGDELLTYCGDWGEIRTYRSRNGRIVSQFAEDY